MLQQVMPPEMVYKQVLPKGFPTIFKQWQLDPMTSNKQWVNNDIVRFNFMNLGKGVFDPYKSYIEFTVSSNLISTPVGGLQIDNSAQSLIQQMVLYSQSREIQRINDYSILAAYLNDVGLSQIVSEGRQTQGLGFGSYQTMPYSRPSGCDVISPTNIGPKTPGAGSTCTMSTSLIMPTIPNGYPYSVPNITNTPITTAAKVSKGHLTNANVCLIDSNNYNGMPNLSQTALQSAMTQTGYANNMRAQYVAKFQQNKFPQSTNSIPNYELVLAKQVSGNKYPFFFSNTKPYQSKVRGQIPYCLYTQSYSHTQSIPCKTSLLGFNNLFTPYFTRGTFQPMISPTIPQNSIQQGIILPTKIPIFRRKFKLPLISAVMGILIDPSQFILIPLQSINTAMIQLTLDPYAFFTTGYSDYCQFDDIGMKVQQRRSYIIERIQYKLQTYFFVDPDVQTYIETSLLKQISIVTNFWAMSNQYQIPGGTPPNNTYIVGCNSTHLNQLVCLFVSNDYQTHSFCRKHYRLSNNITKFWSKLAVDYWPPQPYKGNAGNVASNEIDYDNSVFVENIYWSGNYMFSKTALPRINAYNFAINTRPYDVKNTATFYAQTMKFNPQATITAQSINMDTAMGMSWIHENRCVGKAAFVISYTPFAQSDHVLQGINVSSISNFQVIFETNGNFVFPRDQTLYLFTRSSGVVRYSMNGIKTYGRG